MESKWLRGAKPSSRRIRRSLVSLKESCLLPQTRERPGLGPLGAEPSQQLRGRAGPEADAPCSPGCRAHVRLPEPGAGTVALRPDPLRLPAPGPGPPAQGEGLSRLAVNRPGHLGRPSVLAPLSLTTTPLTLCVGPQNAFPPSWGRIPFPPAVQRMVLQGFPPAPALEESAHSLSGPASDPISLAGRGFHTRAGRPAALSAGSSY